MLTHLAITPGTPPPPAAVAATLSRAELEEQEEIAEAFFAEGCELHARGRMSSMAYLKDVALPTTS